MDMQGFVYNGVRVFSSNLAERSIEKQKRFRRLNRPDKVKTKTVRVPCAFQAFGNIYMHPKLIEKLPRILPGRIAGFKEFEK